MPACIKGHFGTVFACAFSPDGARIASTASDGTLRLWNVATGRPIGFRIHLLPHGEFVSLTPESDRVLHASAEAWRYLGWLAPGPDGKITGIRLRFSASCRRNA